MRTPQVRAKAPRRNLIEMADIIYKAYPKHVDEGPSKKAVKALLSTGVNGHAPLSYEELLDAVAEYAKAVSTWPEDQKVYVPKLVSWIMNGKFKDDRKEWYRNGAKKAGQPSGEFNRQPNNPTQKVYRGFEGKSQELDL